MKAPLVWSIALCLAVSLGAQAPSGSGAAGAYSPEQLDQLLGPIALYPDPLVALILPAATDPSDLTLAAAYLAGNADPAGIDGQPWDPSVKGLAHYPAVLQWMAGNLDWTQAVGAAFAQQPAEVMKSIQQLRAQAVAAGTLVSNAQQQVVMEGDDITIVPTQPDTIYVPEYDPDAVYDGSGADLITFSTGYPVGAWLGYECDWDDFGIWVAPWHPGWAYRRDWRNGGGGNRWRPDPGRVRPVVRNFYRPGASAPHPRPIGGARLAPGRPVPAPRPRLEVPVERPDYRGWSGAEAPRPAPARAPGALYGGYNRGTQTRTFSDRGQASRQAPVRSFTPRAAPARSAPAPRGNERR
jgi:hypothetical protein